MQVLTPVFKKYLLLSLSLVGLIYTTSVLSAAPLAPNRGILTISFIDVGRGDSALIQAPDGYNILIDGGNMNSGPTVLAYLKARNVQDIDVMIATHTDNDHFGGLIDVLKSDLPIGRVYTNGYPETTDNWNTFKTAVAEEGLKMRVMSYPQVYSWGSLTARVLNPVPGYLYAPDSETNRQSIVLMLEFGRNRFLFTGDIPIEIENEMIARRVSLSADILKVAHHGAASSSGEDFLAAVKPKYAIISVGPNSYGFPEKETLERLKAAGATVLRTDEIGTIVVRSDGFLYSVNSPLALGHSFIPMLPNHYFPTPTDTPTFTPTPTPTRTPTLTPVPPTPVVETSTPTRTDIPTWTETPTPTPTQ